MMQSTHVAVTIFVLAVAPWSRAQEAIAPSAAEIASAELAITEAALRGHIRFLASDLLEGRGPGSRGDELAQA